LEVMLSYLSIIAIHLIKHGHILIK